MQDLIFYKKDLSKGEATKLVEQKKAHMFILLADSAKISQEAIKARVESAFEDLVKAGQLFHTWFVV